MNITLKINFNGQEIPVGDIWFDRMGCEYEINIPHTIQADEYAIQQRGFYSYDAGEFCISFDLWDHESGEVGNFYFDTEMEMKFKDGGKYYCKEYNPMNYNPILAAIKK